MAADRLVLVADDLAKALQAATDVRRRRVATAVSRAALQSVGVSDERILEGLRALGDAKYGDTRARGGVQAVVDALDETYFELQEHLDAGELSDASDVVAAFARARAVNALWFALDSDSLRAAGEATYEADAALGDNGTLNVRQIVAAALTEGEPH